MGERVSWEGLRRQQRFIVRVGMILGGGLDPLRQGIMRGGWTVGLEDRLAERGFGVSALLE
jgi:hypothetical protein